jgi:hypothetical protein
MVTDTHGEMVAMRIESAGGGRLVYRLEMRRIDGLRLEVLLSERAGDELVEHLREQIFQGRNAWTRSCARA